MNNTIKNKRLNKVRFTCDLEVSCINDKFILTFNESQINFNPSH